MADDVLPPALVDDAPAWESELDEALLVGGDWPEEVSRFRIDSTGLAEWAMRKLAALARRANEVGQQAQVWRARIDLWESEELRRVQPAQGFFEGALKEWALEQRRADPKRATWALPSGKVSTRQAKEPSVILAVDDTSEALIEWLAGALSGEEYDAAVKTKPKVLISELRKLVKINKQDGPDVEEGGDRGVIYTVVLASTGELVPGVSVELPSTTVTVSVDT